MLYTLDDVLITTRQALAAGLKAGTFVFVADGPQECVDLANSFGTADEHVIRKALTSQKSTGGVGNFHAFGGNGEYDKPYPFSLEGGEYYQCCIIRKNFKKVEVPFDFRDKDVITRLMSALLTERHPDGRSPHYLRVIEMSPNRVWIGVPDDRGYTPQDLLEQFMFLDGTICGKIETKEIM